VVNDFLADTDVGTLDNLPASLGIVIRATYAGEINSHKKVAIGESK